jgi:hypothetical protein
MADFGYFGNGRSETTTPAGLPAQRAFSNDSRTVTPVPA